MSAAQAKVNLIMSKSFSTTIHKLGAKPFIKKKMLFLRIYIRAQNLSQPLMVQRLKIKWIKKHICN